MRKILVTGSNGQLGSEFRELASRNSEFEFYLYDKSQLDISNQEKVEEEVAKLKPDFLINCAAYTAVDKAETDAATAYSINADAAKNLAAACSAHNVRFVHVSTDYVFDGSGKQPYKEDDPVSPVNLYGASKLQGEQEVVKANSKSIIIRTAWVYSTFGNNFVKTMLRLMGSRPEINVVNDQFGTPTYAADIAAAILQIIQSPKWVPGVYHFSNDGLISWYDFAVAIKQNIGSGCNVNPIPTEQYPTPAKRPHYSVLDKTKIKSTYNLQLKDWKESLQQCLKKLSLQEGSNA